jgi:hypothetical protein
MVAKQVSGYRERKLQECLQVCEQCKEDEREKRDAFKEAEQQHNREQGSSRVARLSFQKMFEVPSSRYSSVQRGGIQAVSSSVNRKNAVLPEPALHSLVEMRNKKAVPGDAETAPLQFKPSTREVVQGTSTALFVVVLKAISLSATSLGLGDATISDAASNFTSTGNSTATAEGFVI